MTAGGFTGLLQNQAVFTELNSPPQPDSSLTCNVDESDSRIWLRVFNSAGEKKLVLRPDTDAYTIGLPLISETNLDIIVRLSQFTSKEPCLLHMQRLHEAFKNDPDLAAIPDSCRLYTYMYARGAIIFHFFMVLAKHIFS